MVVTALTTLEKYMEQDRVDCPAGPEIYAYLVEVIRLSGQELSHSCNRVIGTLKFFLLLTSRIYVLTVEL